MRNTTLLVPIVISTMLCMRMLMSVIWEGNWKLMLTGRHDR